MPNSTKANSPPCASRITNTGRSARGCGISRPMPHSTTDLTTRNPTTTAATTQAANTTPPAVGLSRAPDGSTAVKALADCGAAQALAHHHGTFQLTDEGFDAPLIALDEALKEAKIPPERLRSHRRLH